MKTKDHIQLSLQTIEELDVLFDTDNIVQVNQLCNKLSNLSVGVGKIVSDAEKLFKSMDAEYDYLLEKKKLELIESGMGVGKAESKAKVDLYDRQKDVLAAEDVYDRSKRFLNRLDKVLESNKQYTSTVKSSNLKHI